MANLVFHEDYTGPRWTYGLTSRPPSSFSLPTDWIVLSNKADAAYAHGTLDFTRELTDAETDRFDLVAV